MDNSTYIKEFKDKLNKTPKEYIEFYENKTNTRLKKFKKDYEKNILELDKLIITVSLGTMAFLIAYVQLEQAVILWNLGIILLLVFALLSVTIFSVICSYIFAVKRDENGVMMATIDEISEELSLLKKLNESTAFKLSQRMEWHEIQSGIFDNRAGTSNMVAQTSFLMGFIDTLILIPISMLLLSNIDFPFDQHMWHFFWGFIVLDILVFCLYKKFLTMDLAKIANDKKTRIQAGS